MSTEVGVYTVSRRMFCIGLTVLAVAGPLFAQEPRPSVPSHLREVQAVLVAAYPELREGRIAWRVESTEAGLVVEARVGSTALEVPAPTPAMLAATVVVDEQGRLQEMRARGTLIASARAKTPTMGMSKGRGADFAAGVRAKYPPDDSEALETLLPSGLAVILGATSVGERTFREVVEDAPEDAQTWHVELKTPAFRYGLVFEPVEGRLLSVVRR